MGIPAESMRGGASTARVPAAVDEADRARRAEAREAAARYVVRAGHAEPGPAVRDDVVQDLLIGRRPAVRVDRAELDAAIDVLDGRGMSAREVAERLGTTQRQVTRRRAARRG